MSPDTARTGKDARLSQVREAYGAAQGHQGGGLRRVSVLGVQAVPELQGHPKYVALGRPRIVVSALSALCALIHISGMLIVIRGWSRLERSGG